MNETLWNREKTIPTRRKPARLIVWEQDGSWARHLRRLLAPDGLRVYETRTSATCREMLGESPASIVVARWTTTNVGELTSLIGRFGRDYPYARVIAVADQILEPLRWRVLESGAVWLCTSPRELGPVVDIVRRHLERVPEPSRSPEQRIWDELPWQTN